jgi:hypothetical protein
VWRLTLPALAFVLLGAHFLRAGVLPGTLLCVALAASLLVPQPSVPRIASIALLLGAGEWLRTLYVVASARAAMDLPWSRLAVILGAVALCTALSPIVFRGEKVRGHYHRQ